MLTWRSSMASSSALWVRGLARLTSSASSSWVKIGPWRKLKRWLARSKIETPMMSAGSRSLVNCTRCQASPSTCASACASVVLPTPGTSSISRWPRASRQARHRRICAGLPRITVSSVSSARAPLEQRPVALKEGLVLGTGVFEQQRDALARADVHLPADLAHAENDRLDPGRLALGRRVGGELLGARVGREHDSRPLHAGERGDALPELLGDEGHERVQRTLQRLEHLAQRALGAALGGAARRLGLQHRLGQLQVPVAEVVPGELVERARGEVEAVVTERGRDVLEHAGEVFF